MPDPRGGGGAYNGRPARPGNPARPDSAHCGAGTDKDRLRKTGVVAGATLASRVLGFLRDMVIAMTLGAGPMADAFFVAFRLPEALRRLLGEGTFSMAVAPALAQAREQSGAQAMFALGRSLLLWALALCVPLTIVCMLNPGPLVQGIAPGFAAEPELLGRTALLLTLCMPYLLTTLAAGVCISLLHVQGRFLSAALSPCLLNVVLITAALGGLFVGWDVGVCLALGLIVAGVGQTLMQGPALRQEGFRWIGPTPLRPPGLAKVGREMLPAMLGASAFQLMLMLASFRATTLGVGAASALYYADRLVQFPLGVAGVAVSTVALPALARLHVAGDGQGFSHAVRQAVRLSLIVSLPAAVGLIMLASPVVALLFGRGAFGDQGVAGTATMLQGLACALPGLSLTRPLLAAVYASGRHRWAVWAGLCGVLAFACGEGVLEQWAGQHAPALALALGAWVQALVLALGGAARATTPCQSALAQFAGCRPMPFLARDDARWLGRVLLACLGMVAAVGGGGALLPDSPGVQAACIPVWAGVFVLGAWALRVPEVVILAGMLHRKKKGAA